MIAGAGEQQKEKAMELEGQEQQKMQQVDARTLQKKENEKSCQQSNRCPLRKEQRLAGQRHVQPIQPVLQELQVPLEPTGIQLVRTKLSQIGAS